jgi:uncharacterized protein with PIN domain
MSKPKFLADENVAKLGKWLRIIGYDVAYQSPATTDAELARRASCEGRIILTRDRDFLKQRMSTKCLLLTSQDTVEQLRTVIETFGLELDRDGFFTRCLRCNVPLEAIRKEEVKSLVSAYVYQTYDQFHQCPTCNKFFWQGSHTEHFLKRLSEIGE